MVLRLAFAPKCDRSSESWVTCSTQYEAQGSGVAQRRTFDRLPALSPITCEISTADCCSVSCGGAKYGRLGDACSCDADGAELLGGLLNATGLNGCTASCTAIG